MLLEFSVSNYRSICEKQVLSLVPSKKQKDYLKNIRQVNNHKILNAQAIYGANSSGKSNLLGAFDILDRLLQVSTKSNSTSNLPYDPFLLKEGMNEQPTGLEIIFLHNETRYRYGFTYNKTKVIEEWLFRKKTGREVNLFNREEEIIDVKSGIDGSTKLINTAIEATRQNSLFLAFCDMLNVKEANQIFEWFAKFSFVNGIDTSKEIFSTFKMWEDKDYRTKIRDYLISLNLGFIDIDVLQKEFDPSELPDELEDSTRKSIIKELSGKIGYRVMSTHKKYNSNGEYINQNETWNFEEKESEGTKKAFHFSGPILKAILSGGVIIIDEIEAKLHPEITLAIIEMFLDNKSNPKNAQIIFATHDTNLLHYAKLRRDQINFVEKNEYESSEIYSLSDFRYNETNKKERHDIDKEKRYLEGRYGAIPMIGKSFRETIMNWYG